MLSRVLLTRNYQIAQTVGLNGFALNQQNIGYITNNYGKNNNEDKKKVVSDKTIKTDNSGNNDLKRFVKYFNENSIEKPFRDIFDQLSPELHRFVNSAREFGNMFDQHLGPRPPVSSSPTDNLFNLNVDVSETPNHYNFVADLPGMSKKDVKVQIIKDKLILSGQRKQEIETKEENIHKIERNFGSFRREFKLPNNCDLEHIKASTKDGVLNIKIPKAETDLVKEISVE
eukprot:TRINITY_DN1310_c0_g1_i1.p1 TRINITY_DN1310_c0_g1~~TRINITY_DN1310_c0_g1_i1.p1  ORF type:complete len:229 (+),score=71.63 TRINITY_DN1310_c0_g1_i1:103-789(+)